ncbi:hypothetical protein [Alteribacter keqinensis]|nr:hypothetical protein [Alteribacter keqinensis]
MKYSTKLLLKYIAIYIGLSALVFLPLRQVFTSGTAQIFLFLVQFAILYTLVVRYYRNTKHLHDEKEK